MRLHLHNPFTYPGRQPGFDPSHLAATGTYLSAVPFGANIMNILTGGIGTVAGSPTAVLDGNIGPALKCAGANDVAYIVTPSIAAHTVAAIFRYNGTSIDSVGGILTTAGISNSIGYTGSTGAAIVLAGGNSEAMGLTFSAGTPYFFAASMTNAVGAIGVISNLSTGQIISGSASFGFSLPAGADVAFGNRSTGGRVGNVQIATGMASTIPLSLSQLLQWAQRPWDFWYPPRMENLIFSGLSKAGPTLPGPTPILMPQILL